jgi:hypothetical protein
MGLMSLMALNCLHGEWPSRQLSEVQEPRLRQGAGAVDDPSRHFGTDN